MSNHRNLYGFMQAHAPEIGPVDQARGLNKSNGESSRDIEQFALTLRRYGYGYGEIRAADIYNAAYEKLQTFRLSALSICGVSAGLAVCGALVGAQAHIIDPLTTGLDMLGLGFIGVAGSLLNVIRYGITSNKFHKQFNAETGHVAEGASIDNSLSRKAEKIFRRYKSDKEFAQSVPYGEGLTKAEPVPDGRILTQRDMFLRLPMDKGDNSRPDERAVDAYDILRELGDVATWNKRKFVNYVAARLRIMAVRNPGFSSPTNLDLVELTKVYEQTYAKRNLLRLNIAAAGLLGALAAPFGVYYAADTMHGMASQIVSNYGKGVALIPSLPFVALAGYNMFRNLRSGQIHRKQRADDKLIIDAPSDPLIAKKAKRQIDKAFVRFARDRNLEL